MRTSRGLAIVLVLFAGLETAAAQHNLLLPHAADVFQPAVIGNPSNPGGGSHRAVSYHGGHTAQQSNQQVIPPSMALRLALSYSPGSQGLGVDLVQGRRLMYAVKLKTGNRVHRVLVDARTGQILGE